MNPLKSVPGTIISGFILAVIIIYLVGGDMSPGEWSSTEKWSLTVWLHVFFGIIWIGLLYYFNFVQVPAVADAGADSGGPGPAGINKYVAPRALWWFRWAALLTWLTGAVALELMPGSSFADAFLLKENVLIIGIGAWLGTIMLFNVWVLIWPNQKKILGMVEATEEQKAKGKFIALMASRTNTLLSIPLIMCMVGHAHNMPL